MNQPTIIITTKKNEIHNIYLFINLHFNIMEMYIIVHIYFNKIASNLLSFLTRKSLQTFFGKTKTKWDGYFYKTIVFIFWISLNSFNEKFLHFSNVFARWYFVFDFMVFIKRNTRTLFFYYHMWTVDTHRYQARIHPTM